MSQFYCREDELRKLNKRYAGDKFECIVIYGRRRVGKTALINEFCKDKPTIFFSALNTTGKENLEALSKSIMSFERPDMESAPEFRSYDAALDELTALSKDVYKRQPSEMWAAFPSIPPRTSEPSATAAAWW